MNRILEIKGVAKSYGAQQVLRPITFEVAEGERICILGPSGCGKSTLLHMVAGLIRIEAGEIAMNGITVEKGGHYVPPERRPINMVFQDYALWPHMTVRQNIEYGMKRRNVARADMQRRLETLQALLRLDGLLDRAPAQLSGGQQQRVGIARALATEPKLLLMDEPLSNLDVKLRTDMRGELAALLETLSTAALYVTHDRMEAFTIADRILILRDGGIDQLGRPQDLFERPASPWVAQLMGYHNRLTCRFSDGGGTIVAGDGAVGGRRMTAGSAGPAVAMTRPESLALRMDPDAEKTNSLAVTVAQSIYEGDRWRIVAETSDGQKLHLFHDGRVESGRRASVFFPPDSTMLYDVPNSDAHG